jgi:hypothetical protein
MARTVLAAVGLVSSLLVWTSAFAASRFDGTWAVSETCPPTAQDVRGYAWSYPATIHKGTLSAQYQADNGGGSIKLQGRVGAEGNAVLNAAGTVGHPETAVGHLSHGTPYHFHVQATFNAASGTGRRLEQRQCDFTFTRS